MRARSSRRRRWRKRSSGEEGSYSTHSTRTGPWVVCVAWVRVVFVVDVRERRFREEEEGDEAAFAVDELRRLVIQN